MTREEAKQLLPIMQAFAEGKVIESRCIKGDKSLWYDDEEFSFDDDFEYRIKPQPTYRPFNDAEECWNEMQKHQPFGWLKDKEFEGQPMYFYFVLKLVDDTFFITGGDKYNWDEGFYNCTFADGEPFGVKEEE